MFKTFLWCSFGGGGVEVMEGWPGGGHSGGHTPSIVFRHLPPDSARFGYATEGALFISAQRSAPSERFWY